MSSNKFVDFCQRTTKKVVQTNCETLEPILSTCRPRLRTAGADTSTQTRRSHAPIVVALLHLSLSSHSSFRSYEVCCVAKLVAQLPLLGLRRLVLCRSSHSCQRGSAACHSSTPSALSALTTARQCRSHGRPHNTSPSTEAPLPLVSFKKTDEFYNVSAVDRVICLFQAHGLEWKTAYDVHKCQSACQLCSDEKSATRIRFMHTSSLTENDPATFDDLELALLKYDPATLQLNCITFWSC